MEGGVAADASSGRDRRGKCPRRPGQRRAAARHRGARRRQRQMPSGVRGDRSRLRLLGRELARAEQLPSCIV
jgi:hypothetical protein